MSFVMPGDKKIPEKIGRLNQGAAASPPIKRKLKGSEKGIKMTHKVIGLMGGGGTRPELIDAVLPSFEAVQALYGAQFDFMRFDDEKWEYESKTEVWDQPFYDAMCRFYDDVKERNGCILRGAVQAPVLYKVREYVNHHFKINPVLGIP
ncbi:MAG: hypothetical protein GY850_42510, partial [bacterium]|nr:hypothetical protein [bacterium]